MQIFMTLNYLQKWHGKTKLYARVFYGFLQFYDCKLSTVHFSELLNCLHTVISCISLKLDTYTEDTIYTITFWIKELQIILMKKTIHQILITFSASSFSPTQNDPFVWNTFQKNNCCAVQHNCELSKVEVEIVDW